jgi:hypothetical protein
MNISNAVIAPKSNVVLMILVMVIHRGARAALS